jgi:hypothetical protein
VRWLAIIIAGMANSDNLQVDAPNSLPVIQNKSMK